MTQYPPGTTLESIVVDLIARVDELERVVLFLSEQDGDIHLEAKE